MLMFYVQCFITACYEQSQKIKNLTSRWNIAYIVLTGTYRYNIHERFSRILDATLNELNPQICI